MPAITPYNFVPLPETVYLPEEAIPTNDRYHGNRHSGWLEVTYKTLTPTYTRAALGVSMNFAQPVTPLVHEQSPDFFHRGDQDRTPVLPGSSLRGMVRAVFEVITQSRMEFVSKRRLFHRSFAAAANSLSDLYNKTFAFSRIIAGVLAEDETGGMTLRVAQDAATKGFAALDVDDPLLPKGLKKWERAEEDRYNIIPVKVTHDEGEPASLMWGKLLLPRVTLTAIPAATEPNGYLVVPGKDLPRKDGNNNETRPRHWYHVILEAKQTSNPPRFYSVSKEVYEDYRAWGDLAHGHKFEGGHGLRTVPRRLKAGEPSFALLDSNDEIVVIGANLMMALRYQNAIHDVAARGSAGADDPRPDMTQAVFGRVLEREARQAAVDAEEPPIIKGRVFFEDAVCQTHMPWLSEEKVGSVKIPDILSGPKPTSVQTYLQQGGPLRHWDSPDAKIRGFKRYWHRPPEAARAALNNASEEKKEKQQTRIRPVREAVEFTGRVRFQNLSLVELGGLYASICLPSGLAHKFGMGKNLGLGSLQALSVRATLLNLPGRYRSFIQKEEYRSEGSSVLCDAYHAFVETMNGEEAETLWTGGRMLSLAALLSLEPMLPSMDTRQVGVEKDTNDEQWKRRTALPPARELWKDKQPTAAAPNDIYEDQMGGDQTLPGQEADALSVSPVPGSPAVQHPVGRAEEDLPLLIASPFPPIAMAMTTPPESAPALVVEPEDTWVRRPAPLPAPFAPRLLQIGDKLALRVLEKTLLGGIIELPDGATLRVTSIGSVNAEGKARFKILKIANGQIKELVPS